MTAQRRPGAHDPATLLIEVHPDYAELATLAAGRELEGIPVELVVTAVLPAGTGARFTIPATLLETLKTRQ